MSDGHPVETDPTTVSRRGFLKVTGAGVAGGTLAAMLDARQAPAQIRGTTLRILQWSHFIPAYDHWFDAVGKKHGGWIPTAGPLVQVEGRTYGMPMFYILLPMLWRKDLFEANNLKAPDTWELARVAARTLKPKGHPTGIQFSQCADANL